MSKTAILKRFKITKTGKILRRRQSGRHLKANKSKSNIRRHKEPILVIGSYVKKIKNLIN